MMIILNILKALVILVYAFFLLDSVFNIKYEMFDKKGQEKDNLPVLNVVDVVYLAYAFFNFVLVVKFLYRAQKNSQKIPILNQRG